MYDCPLSQISTSAVTTSKKAGNFSANRQLLSQMVKNLPAMWETQLSSLDWEDPLEKEMATQASILAWKIPRTGKPGGL